MSIDDPRPIGVFDSGVGGLTVVRALMERLPLEGIVYFGDTARVPYGVKSVETICHFASEITRYLVAQDVKMLIVACNTMAAVATDAVLRPTHQARRGSGTPNRRAPSTAWAEVKTTAA